MRAVVDFQGKSLDLETPDERVVACWRGPEGLDPGEAASVIGEALEAPRDFPALREMIVPGDRVALAVDPTIPSPGLVVEQVAAVLEAAGVDRETLTVLVPRAASAPEEGQRLGGVRVAVHDPDDRSGIAYLASTREGRRVYLNRLLTDADVVLPVGRLGPDPDLGFRGPWSVLFPGLSDRETLRVFRDHALPRPGTHAGPGARARLDESIEVSWLLGSQFSLGIVPAARGLIEVVAGRDAAVREQGIAAVEREWTFEAPSRAELVIAGVGGADSAVTLEDIAAALDTATRLVQHGGKIVVLSRAAGAIGPAVQRLMGLDDPRESMNALRGHEADEDYPIACRIAQATAWCDVFLSSALDPQTVEDLAIVPLERSEQARRLAAASGSITIVSRAELTRARAVDDVE